MVHQSIASNHSAEAVLCLARDQRDEVLACGDSSGNVQVWRIGQADDSTSPFLKPLSHFNATDAGAVISLTFVEPADCEDWFLAVGTSVGNVKLFTGAGIALGTLGASGTWDLKDISKYTSKGFGLPPREWDETQAASTLSFQHSRRSSAAPWSARRLSHRSGHHSSSASISNAIDTTKSQIGDADTTTPHHPDSVHFYQHRLKEIEAIKSRGSVRIPNIGEIWARLDPDTNNFHQFVTITRVDEVQDIIEGYDGLRWFPWEAEGRQRGPPPANTASILESMRLRVTFEEFAQVADSSPWTHMSDLSPYIGRIFEDDSSRSMERMSTKMVQHVMSEARRRISTMSRSERSKQTGGGFFSQDDDAPLLCPALPAGPPPSAFAGKGQPGHFPPSATGAAAAPASQQAQSSTSAAPPAPPAPFKILFIRALNGNYDVIDCRLRSHPLPEWPDGHVPSTSLSLYQLGDKPTGVVVSVAQKERAYELMRTRLRQRRGLLSHADEVVARPTALSSPERRWRSDTDPRQAASRTVDQASLIVSLASSTCDMTHSSSTLQSVDQSEVASIATATPEPRRRGVAPSVARRNVPLFGSSSKPPMGIPTTGIRPTATTSTTSKPRSLVTEIQSLRAEHTGRLRFNSVETMEALAATDELDALLGSAYARHRERGSPVEPAEDQKPMKQTELGLTSRRSSRQDGCHTPQLSERSVLGVARTAAPLINAGGELALAKAQRAIAQRRKAQQHTVCAVQCLMCGVQWISHAPPPLRICSSSCASISTIS